ncbi:MAG TPA: hypothetical protein VJJ83_04610, partial [Candidatus Babeliales bacterium]|nr:hypothetical protein [Candidatus Babeliales bacterium]
MKLVATIAIIGILTSSSSLASEIPASAAAAVAPLTTVLTSRQQVAAQRIAHGLDARFAKSGYHAREVLSDLRAQKPLVIASTAAVASAAGASVVPVSVPVSASASLVAPVRVGSPSRISPGPTGGRGQSVASARSFNRYYASDSDSPEGDGAAAVGAPGQLDATVQQLAGNIAGVVKVMSAQAETVAHLTQVVAAADQAVCLLQARLDGLESQTGAKPSIGVTPLDLAALTAQRAPAPVLSAEISISSASASSMDASAQGATSLTSARSDGSGADTVRVVENLDAVLLPSPVRHAASSAKRPLSPSKLATHGALVSVG